MKSHRLILLVLLAVASARWCDAAAPAEPSSPAAQRLTELEKRAPKGDADAAQFAPFHAEVIRLVESNTLATGDEFFNASNLAELGWPDFRAMRTHYELLLAAVAKDGAEAEKYLPDAWDGLLGELGRAVRLDFNGWAKQNPDYREIDPAPKCIQAVLRDPAAARAAAKSAKDNSEMQTIVDADQAARQKDWGKLTKAELQAVGDGDHQRNARTREIVAAGGLHTADDFANASLVMQHSSRFAGYELAHELAVCSLLLGDRATGRWLVAATYDRMLDSVGHDQRFGTQYMNDTLMRVDEEGICDAERLALGCQSLMAQLGNTLVRQAESLLAAKKFTEAEPVARDGLARRAKGFPAGAWQIFSAQRALGASLLGQRKFAEAETVLLEAYAGLKKNEAAIPADYKVRIRDAADYLAQLYAERGPPAKAREWKQRVEEFDRANPKRD